MPAKEEGESGFRLRKVEPPEQKQTQQAAPEETKLKGSRAKKTFLTLLCAVVLGLGAAGGYQAFEVFSTHEETDDAYVTGHLHQVSTRVNGTVEKVLVDDNEHVKEGQVLVTLDARDYKAQADQALANLEQAERQAKTVQSSISFQDTTAQGQDTNARGSIDNAVAAIARAQAQVREARANIVSAQENLVAKEAELQRAEADYKRYDVLEQEGAISTSQRDAARRDYFVALGNRDAAKSGIIEATERLQQAQHSVRTSEADLTKAQAEAKLAKASAIQTVVTEHQYQAAQAAVASAKAALEAAELNLSYTRIVAPTTGRVGKKTVEEGQRVEPGQPLLTIVADNPWVVANFKETQLKKMQAGQKVEIKIDSFPDHKFEGTVLSFSPASGASFAVLPSDNATGNFTKIVQRVPVKILFTPDSIHGYEDRLAPGLSVITSVDVSDHARDHQLARLQ
jgi:membrane fusion protein (multidrug efflux system)